MTQPFAMVPLDLVARCNAEIGSNGALATLVGLASFADTAGVAYPAIGTLADRVALPRRTVQRALARLEKAGLIDRDGKCGQGVIRWRLASRAPGAPATDPQGAPPTAHVGDEGAPPAAHVGCATHGAPCGKPGENGAPPTAHVGDEGAPPAAHVGGQGAPPTALNVRHPRRTEHTRELRELSRLSGLTRGGPASESAQTGDGAGCATAAKEPPARDPDRAAMAWVTRKLAEDPRWLPKLELRDAEDRVRATAALVARYAAVWPARSLEVWWHVAHRPEARRLADDPVAYVCALLRRAIDARSVPRTREGRPDPLWTACVAGDYEGALQELRRRTLPAGTRDAGTDPDPADGPGAAPTTDVGDAKRVLPGSADQLVPHRGLLPPAAARNGHDLAGEEWALSAASAGGQR